MIDETNQGIVSPVGNLNYSQLRVAKRKERCTTLYLSGQKYPKRIDLSCQAKSAQNNLKITN